MKKLSTLVIIFASLCLISTVAQADNELRMPVIGVVLHQIPQYGLVAYIDERLWNGVRVLAQPRPHTAAKQHDFHSVSPADTSALESIFRELGMQSGCSGREPSRGLSSVRPIFVCTGIL